MNMPSNSNLFRLIKPVDSNKVYNGKTIMHGAGKCYKELKSKNIQSNSFSIIEINQNQVYTFKIKSMPKIENLITNNQTGGIGLSLSLNQKSREDFILLKKIDGLEKNIQSLTIRLSKLESSASSKPLEKI